MSFVGAVMEGALSPGSGLRMGLGAAAPVLGAGDKPLGPVVPNTPKLREGPSAVRWASFQRFFCLC